MPASCVYVVVLETTLIFGLYARRNWIFYATLAQLVAFHIFSWPIVGFWYPTLMFCLLSILPLMRLLGDPGLRLQRRRPVNRLPRLGTGG